MVLLAAVLQVTGISRQCAEAESFSHASNIFWVVVSKIFYFHPYLGKIPILTNIFQRG